MFDDLSEFISKTEASLDENGRWTVCCNPQKKVGHIYNCEGKNEFEAKESAFHYIKDLKIEIDKMRGE